MGKIIFLDVDGTLVDYGNKLPVSAVTAIRQARSNGHRVYICTGRSRAEVYPELWDIGLDGMIGGNGGEEIRAMADMVTDDVDKDGLYKAFEKLGLLEK